MKFKTKPVVIEAIQFTGGNANEVMQFTNGKAGSQLQINGLTFIEIETLEGVMYADRNDWIIRGVLGEFYPCKPAAFEGKYEPV